MHRRPRALVLAPSAYPLGGVATWLDALVPGLEERDWDVQVGLVAGVHHDVGRYLSAHPFGKVVPVPNRTGTRVGRVRELGRVIRHSRPDVILSTNLADVECAVNALRTRRASNARLMTVQHAILPDFFAHLHDHRAIVDVVVCTNRLSAALAERFSGTPPDRIRYAPYGVEVSGDRQPMHTRDGSLRILWAGRIESEQKRACDIPPIVRSLALRHDAWTLTIAGAGPEERELRERLAEFGDRVRFLGSVPRHAMVQVAYSQADVLLITSRWETGPIVAWEALASGVSIVTSQFIGSGLEGALVDGATALCYPIGDAELAAGALIRSADPAVRRMLVERGRALVRDRYSPSASLGAWHEALLDALGRRPREPITVTPRTAPSGRLDRWLGVRCGETVRRLTRRHNRQSEPGAEWPHAYGSRDAQEFFRLSAHLDRVASAADEVANTAAAAERDAP